MQEVMEENSLLRKKIPEDVESQTTENSSKMKKLL